MATELCAFLGLHLIVYFVMYIKESFNAEYPVKYSSLLFFCFVLDALFQVSFFMESD